MKAARKLDRPLRANAELIVDFLYTYSERITESLRKQLNLFFYSICC